ncbi:MAG: DUF6510 family protein [Acidimicrobiia bacterium]
MTADSHVDGNAVGGELIDMFGREMTDAFTCCGACGYVGQFGSLILYQRAPGKVLRCPVCEAVLLVVVDHPSDIRVNFVGLRWMEQRSSDF